MLDMLQDVNIGIPFVMSSQGATGHLCVDFAILSLFRCLWQFHRGSLLRFYREIIGSLRGCCDRFSRRDDAALATGTFARHPQELLHLNVIDFDEGGHVSVSSPFLASR